MATNTDDQHKNPKIFFVPRGGITFSSVQRNVLKSKLQSLGAVFVDEIWSAQYIVISETVKSLSEVSKALKIKEEKLKTTFRYTRG